MINITIDGKKISCAEDRLLLDVALDNGIYIPNLCHHPDLKPLGACRLCVVEVEGVKDVVTSCDTKVWDGMTVTTKTPRTDKIRALSMELMLQQHPAECTGCPKYGKCEMQILIQYCGVTNAHLRAIPNPRSKNEKNPLIVHDLLRCIKCGRCVRACRELRGVDVLDYLVDPKTGDTYVGCAKDMLADADCRFCQACVEVCPTSAIRDQEGIFRDDLPREQALIPCTAECPIHTDIPSYLRFIREGKYSESQAVIREQSPFPHALGLVCNNRCELGCKRGKVNDPISIRNLKRYAVEHDTEQIWRGKGFMKPRTGKKIAVVGGGPCGMTAAYYLNKLGHDVTVFEKQKIAGGHMTGGMPEYRIPTKDVVKELDYIVESGVKLVCDSEIKNFAELKKDYDAVLVAMGTSIGKKLGYLPGSKLDNVYTAVDLLRAYRLGLPIKLGKTTCIIGGGNVAFDVACTALRMGVTVNVVCLEKDASQASPDERDMALEEGVNLFDSHSNEAILGTQEQVTGLQVHKINSFYFHPETRALVEDPIPDSTYVIPCDSIIFAAGQVTGLNDSCGIELNRFGYPIDPATGKSGFNTSVEGVFAAGDVITGTKFVVDAIASARACVSEIDKYLGGDGDISETLVERVKDPHIGKIEHFAEMSREEMAVKSAAERLAQPDEPISDGFTCEQAGCEAERCLQCDLRLQISRPKFWADFQQN